MKIAIDAGHGMGNRSPGVYDPGAVGNGYQEAYIALTWALTGRWVLGRAGIEAFLTRPDAETNTPLSNRVRRALSVGCTHYISLHCNAAGTPVPGGLEVYYRGKEDYPLALEVERCLLRATYTPETGGMHSRGLKLEGQSQHNRLAVLDFPGPACLLELGFISNPDDVQILVSRQARIAFWEHLVDALGKE